MEAEAFHCLLESCNSPGDHEARDKSVAYGFREVGFPIAWKLAAQVFLLNDAELIPEFRDLVEDIAYCGSFLVHVLVCYQTRFDRLRRSVPVGVGVFSGDRDFHPVCAPGDGVRELDFHDFGNFPRFPDALDFVEVGKPAGSSVVSSELLDLFANLSELHFCFLLWKDDLYLGFIIQCALRNVNSEFKYFIRYFVLFVRGGDDVQDKLTAKQQRFIDEYLVDFNATQAAIRAGYRKQNAYQIGSENLRKPKIQSEIARRQRDLQKRTEVSQDRVVKELARIAFVDASVVCVTDFDKLTDDQRAAIQGAKPTNFGWEIKLCDKIKALELLGRHIGMFADKLEVKGSIDIASVLAAARGRVSNRGEPTE
nr:MAG TPA: Terminase small subunit [Caudoviricetes sp.]